MTEPKAVVFDLGKVLLDFDYSKAVARLASPGKSSAKEIHGYINQSTLLHRYETGLMTTQEFYDEVRSLTAYQGDLAEFKKMFGDIFTPMDEMIRLHARLKSKNIPCYIFSNTNELAIEHINASYPFFSGFTGYIYSYQHGSMKPHHRLYEVVEETTGHKGDSLLYIDDRAENIEMGAKRGWRVILQETPEKTLIAMKSHLPKLWI
jgi:HAD superfamily hydrolase (TIGR01509 family)